VASESQTHVEPPERELVTGHRTLATAFEIHHSLTLGKHSRNIRDIESYAEPGHQ
jgi:hypothetical protein